MYSFILFVKYFLSLYVLLDGALKIITIIKKIIFNTKLYDVQDLISIFNKFHYYYILEIKTCGFESRIRDVCS